MPAKVFVEFLPGPDCFPLASHPPGRYEQGRECVEHGVRAFIAAKGAIHPNQGQRAALPSPHRVRGLRARPNADRGDGAGLQPFPIGGRRGPRGVAPGWDEPGLRPWLGVNRKPSSPDSWELLVGLRQPEG